MHTIRIELISVHAVETVSMPNTRSQVHFSLKTSGREAKRMCASRLRANGLLLGSTRVPW